MVMKCHSEILKLLPGKTEIMHRRDFAKTLGLGLVATQTFPAFATTELLSNNNDKVPIGLCNHSLRGMRLNAQQFIEYATKQKLDSVLFNTFQPFESLEKKYLTDLKKMAQSNDVSIYTGAGSISEKSTKFSDKYGTAGELLKEGIRVANLVGSPIVGCRIGAIDDRYTKGGIEAHMEAVIKVMKSVRSQALDANIKFAFENHAGDLRTEELLTIINETGTDICGALFDPANAVWAMEDPMVALKKLGSIIVCTSVRDIQAWETNDGATFQGMAIGEGILDFQLYAKTVAELSPGVPLHIETISNSARPVPFLKPEFWEGFPNLKAEGLVDFLKMIKKGTPQEIINPLLGMSKKEFDIEHQQSELAKSVNYLRERCYAGNNILKTPNLDRLAKEGVYFKNAYTQCAVCTPARASILTGCSVANTKVISNSLAYNSEETGIMPMKTYDEILAENGYECEYYGKWHTPTFRPWRNVGQPRVKGQIQFL